MMTLIKVELNDTSHDVSFVPVVGMYLDDKKNVFYIIDEGYGPELLENDVTPGYAYTLYVNDGIGVSQVVDFLLDRIKSYK